MLCDGVVLVDRPIVRERLRTPARHLDVLVEPDAEHIRHAATASPDPLVSDARLLDVSAGMLRRTLRGRLGLRGPVILTGHQAEFGHAGVFAKTIAVDALLRTLGGTGVFLAVDSDLPKTTHLAIPCLVAGRVRRRYVTIPGCDPRLPMDSQPAAPQDAWRAFFAQLAACVERPQETLLPVFAEGLEAAQRPEVDFRDVVERGHAAVERALRLASPLHLRVSSLVRTPEFRAVVAHIVLRGREFAECYNAAQRAYRIRHKVRNRQRPAPVLNIERDRVELPFWIRRTGQRRHRLFVRIHGGRVEFFADDQPAGADDAARLGRASEHATPWALERAGWQILPRALILSAFTRLLVSDLFVHGIGGAKYDEMTEDFARRFWGTPLPAACCISATAYLPLPLSDISDKTLAQIRRNRRDLHFNPQRHLANLPSTLLERRTSLIQQSRALRRARPADRAARRRVFLELREVNHALLHSDPEQAAALERGWRDVERRARCDRIARDREVFFALHPRRVIEQLAERLRAALAPASEHRRGAP